jgi:Flp pilus assembly protein TadG
MRNRRAGDSGSVALELAILLPVFMVVIGGIVDVGNVLRVQVELQEAVQDGVAYAVENPGTPSATRQRVNTADSEVTPITVTVTCSGTAPVVVSVRGQHSHHWLLGLLFKTSLNMKAEVSGEVMSSATCVSG